MMSLKRPSILTLAFLLMSSCIDTEVSPSSLRLTGVYDLSAVAALQPAASGRFFWQEDEVVGRACGPIRAPGGLGRQEAELMFNRQMPVLAIVLEGHRPSSQPLHSDELRIFLERPQGKGAQRSALLKPAVMPGILRVEAGNTILAPDLAQGTGPKNVDERVATQHVQTLLRQLTVQLCLEHKLGRAWSGNEDPERLRQAFLLTRAQTQPSGMDGATSNAFFVGQAEPVAALLGPISWTFDRPMPGKLQNAAWLNDIWSLWGESETLGSEVVETDIWAAHAPQTDRRQIAAWSLSAVSGKTIAKTAQASLSNQPAKHKEDPWEGVERQARERMLPLQIGMGRPCIPSRLSEHFTPRATPCLELLSPRLRGLLLEMEDGSDQRAQVVGQLFKRDPASPTYAIPIPSELGGRLIPRAPDQQDGFKENLAEDVVAELPREYPTWRSNDGSDTHYTLLLIPEWQVEYALTQLSSGEGTTALSGKVPHDSVGYLLQHIELLHIQEVEKKLPSSHEARTVPDLASPLRGWRSYVPGHFPDLQAVEAVLLLPGENLPLTPQQRWAAFRSDWVVSQTSALAFLLFVMLAGRRRLPELWQHTPVERAAWWPGVSEEGPLSVPKAPDAPGGEKGANEKGSRDVSGSSEALKPTPGGPSSP